MSLDTQSLLIRAGELGISSTHAHQGLAEGGCEALARLICETQPINPSPTQETEDDE